MEKNQVQQPQSQQQGDKVDISLLMNEYQKEINRLTEDKLMNRVLIAQLRNTIEELKQENDDLKKEKRDNEEAKKEAKE